MHYAKNDVFVQQDFVSKFLGVVKSGYFKYTILTSSGNEAIVGFAFEGGDCRRLPKLISVPPD